MFLILGILVVFGAVLGGFLMEKGPVLVLMQPSEFLIIGGAALGTLLSANPVYVLKRILSGLITVLTGSRYSRRSSSISATDPAEAGLAVIRRLSTRDVLSSASFVVVEYAPPLPLSSCENAPKVWNPL